jgi:hypothetical protein
MDGIFYMMKETKNRMLSLILIAVLIYLPVSIIGDIMDIFFNQEWVNTPVAVISILMNLFIIIGLGIYWFSYNKELKEKEKFQDEHDKSIKMANQRLAELHLKDSEMEKDWPLMEAFNYRKACKEIAFLYTIVILANAASLVFNIVRF